MPTTDFHNSLMEHQLSPIFALVASVSVHQLCFCQTNPPVQNNDTRTSTGMSLGRIVSLWAMWRPLLCRNLSVPMMRQTLHSWAAPPIPWAVRRCHGRLRPTRGVGSADRMGCSADDMRVSAEPVGSVPPTPKAAPPTNFGRCLANFCRVVVEIRQMRPNCYR